MVHELTVRFVITSQRLAAALAALLLLASPRICSTADYRDISTVTTYYPQPSAIFSNPGAAPALVVTGRTDIGRDYGLVQFGDTDAATTKVQMGGEWAGTDPVEVGATAINALRIKGALRIDGCIWLKNAIRERAAPLQPERVPRGQMPGSPPAYRLENFDMFWRCRWSG